jgi:hypothetical protein
VACFPHPLFGTGSWPGSRKILPGSLIPSFFLTVFLLHQPVTGSPALPNVYERERSGLCMALDISLNLIIIMGIIVFLSLIITASFGLLMLRGKAGITLRMHMNMALLTIILAVIHAFLGMVFFFGI